jgi:hypothetical protein
MNPTQYIGDDVYLKDDNGKLVLYSTDGVTTQDEIFLDEDTLRNFLKAIKGTTLEHVLEEIVDHG